MREAGKSAVYIDAPAPLLLLYSIEQGGCGQGGWMEESARVVQSSIGLLTYKTRALCLRKRQQRQWISQWMGLWNALVGVSVY